MAASPRPPCHCQPASLPESTGSFERTHPRHWRRRGASGQTPGTHRALVPLLATYTTVNHAPPAVDVLVRDRVLACAYVLDGAVVSRLELELCLNLLASRTARTNVHGQ